MATTINAYSVSLGLDASSYIDGAKLSRKETQQLKRDIEAARTPAEKYAQEQDRLTRALNEGAISEATYNRLLEDKKRKLDAATASMNRINNETEKSTANSGVLIGQLKGVVAGYVGLHTATKAIRLAIDAEQAAASFEVMTGSIETSKALLADIRDFAAVSPVSLSGAQDAAKMMLQFNIPVQEVGRNLRMLSDITGGNQQRFDMLALAFSQMSAAGRLMGQELLQMVNAGFNPLQEISARTGETMVELKARMEAGGISTREVTDAFVAATSEGGRFAGLSDRLSQTMGGKLAIALAQVELGLTQVGQALAPLVIQLTDGFNEGKSAIDSMVAVVRKLADGLGFVLALSRDFAEMHKRILSFEAVDINNLPGAFASTDKFMAEYEARQRALQEAAAAGSIPAMQPQLDVLADNFGEVLDAHVQAHEEYLKAQDEMYQKLASNALQNAKRYFEDERKRAMQMRDDVAKGPSSIEAGSAEAAKFMAEQVNAAIGAAAVPELPTPGEAELIAEAQRQAALLEAQATRDEEQLAAIKLLLEEAKKNGFSRIR